MARQIVAALRGRRRRRGATIDAPDEPSKIAGALGGLGHDDYPYDFNLICVNADMLPVVAEALGRRFFEGRHTIGLWWWEVSHFPEQWRQAFDHVDEVWVGSEHVAEALRRALLDPGRARSACRSSPADPPRLSRAELGLPEGFCFLFVFDYHSVFQRKNPLGPRRGVPRGVRAGRRAPRW